MKSSLKPLPESKHISLSIKNMDKELKGGYSNITPSTLSIINHPITKAYTSNE
jgi:hypothetical protein